MTDANQLSPAALAALGAGLRPMVAKMHLWLSAPARAADAPIFPLSFLSGRLDTLLDEGAVRLVGELHALGALLAGAGASEAAIESRVGRIERCIDTLLTGYREVQLAGCEGQCAYGQELLLLAYRHFLKELLDWLAAVAEICADPKGAAEKRGLPTRGKVAIPIALELTLPASLKEFNQWLARQRQAEAAEEAAWSENERAAMVAAQPPREPLDFGGVVIAVTLGVGLGELLFDDD